MSLSSLSSIKVRQILSSNKFRPLLQIKFIGTESCPSTYALSGTAHTTMAKLNSCEKDRWPASPKNFCCFNLSRNVH